MIDSHADPTAVALRGHRPRKEWRAPNSGSAKSWTFTLSGCPFGRYSRLRFVAYELFFFVSTEITWSGRRRSEPGDIDVLKLSVAIRDDLLLPASAVASLRLYPNVEEVCHNAMTHWVPHCFRSQPNAEHSGGRPHGRLGISTLRRIDGSSISFRVCIHAFLRPPPGRPTTS